jgi:3',5'-cyclic AMP phosphodiesterase CpdA
MAQTLLTFVHISDTHLTPGDSREFRQSHYSPRFMNFIAELQAKGVDLGSHDGGVPASVANRALVEAVNALPFPLDFILHTGDVMTDPDTVDEYETARAMFTQLRAPVYFLRGNHDHLDGLRTLMPTVTAAHGTLDYVIEHNGVRVVCVDSATHGEDHGGCLSAEQLVWLETALLTEPEKPLLAAIHHLPMKLENDVLDFFGVANGDAVHTIYKKAAPRLQAVFFGHIHQIIDVVQDGVLYTTVPSPVSQPNILPGGLQGAGHHAPSPGFSVVVVTSERTYIRRYTYPMPQA